MERRFESVVSATPERVWQWVTSMKCINRELSPLMRMTHPADRESLGDVELEMPAHLFDSLLLLFGWLPIDRSRLTLLELEPGRRFLERSPMLAMKLWQHERTVEASGGGTRVVDRLSFEPRLASFLVVRFVEVLCRHRHAVIRRELGAGPT